VAGRAFEVRDDASATKVAIVNQTTARAFWGNRDPVGRRLRLRGADAWCVIVGVIADVKNSGIDRPTGTEIYFPYAQAEDYMLRSVRIAVHSDAAPSTVVNAVRQEVHRIDPALPLTKVHTMEEVVSASQARPRFLAVLLSIFASVTLVLAAVGIYGVISYAVAQRTREFGIRMALGARGGAVLSLVIGRGLLLTLCGVAIGVAGAFGLTRLLSGFLFNVSATDPATFAAVALLLTATAVAASYVPARRATRVDPLVALRAE